MTYKDLCKSRAKGCFLKSIIICCESNSFDNCWPSQIGGGWGEDRSI